MTLAVVMEYEVPVIAAETVLAPALLSLELSAPAFPVPVFPEVALTASPSSALTLVIVPLFVAVIMPVSSMSLSFDIADAMSLNSSSYTIFLR